MAISGMPMLAVQPVVDDVLRRRQRHLLQLVGGGLENVHFLRGEFVERRLVPVGLLAGVPGQPDLFDLLLPVRPWRSGDSVACLSPRRVAGAA